MEMSLDFIDLKEPSQDRHLIKELVLLRQYKAEREQMQETNNRLIDELSSMEANLTTTKAHLEARSIEVATLKKRLRKQINSESWKQDNLIFSTEPTESVSEARQRLESEGKSWEQKYLQAADALEQAKLDHECELKEKDKAITHLQRKVKELQNKQSLLTKEIQDLRAPKHKFSGSLSPSCKKLPSRGKPPTSSKGNWLR